MKSGKKRRQEIFAKRRAKASQKLVDVYQRPEILPEGAIWANFDELAHNNTYGTLPYFYLDRIFICADCCKEELWTAKQQKWWYEIVKGHIESRAIRCRSCRDKIKAAKDEQKRHMETMAKKTPHPNEAFFRSI